MIPSTIPTDQIPPAKVVRLELFPATVSDLTDLPDGDLKAVVTDTHLLVLGNSPTGPILSHVLPITGYTRYDKKTKARTATLEDGTVLQLTRTTSCGCGSRLRGVNLYPSTPRAL